MNRLLTIGVVLYVLVGIVVFGNAAVHFEQKGNAAAAECQRESTPAERPYCGFEKSTGIGAAFAALLWPFYLSYRFAQLSKEPT